jgi:hypothetical protein
MEIKETSWNLKCAENKCHFLISNGIFCTFEVVSIEYFWVVKKRIEDEFGLSIDPVIFSDLKFHGHKKKDIF